MGSAGTKWLGAKPAAMSLGNHVIPLQITGWVSRTARLRAPATQPMKEVAREGRGNPSADLAVSSGAS
jgi:hypothetical protein